MNLISGCAMWVSKQKMKKNISNYSMMNHKVSYIYTLVLFILTCLMCSQAVLAAPPTIEIYSGSGSGQGPTASQPQHFCLIEITHLIIVRHMHRLQQLLYDYNSVYNHLIQGSSTRPDFYRWRYGYK
jgi:hypothetical protein